MADGVKLIDANKLKQEIELFCEDERTNMTAIAYFALLELVDTMPTIEAEPVKHGKWIEKKVSRMKWIPYADDDVNPDDVDIECMTEQKCSYCKRWTIKFTYHIELDYCPLCGAKMDLKEI